MNIAVVAPAPVPLAVGGAERLWWGLVEHLNRDTPHQADLIKIPAPERNFWEVLDSYRRFAALDVSEYDAVITGKYPAWMVDHPRHVVYMLHPLRGLYDSYPPDLEGEVDASHPAVAALLAALESPDRAALPEIFARLDELRACGDAPGEAFAFPGPLIRRVVRALDAIALAGVRRFAAISATVARRPDYFPPGAEVQVAHPPSPLAGQARRGSGRYIFTASRLDGAKRIELLLLAMGQVRRDVELRIAGTGPLAGRLREVSANDPRIKLLGFVNDPDLLDLYAHARAVAFVPHDEDWGFIAPEALEAGKPVITTTDAGGPTEIVEHERSGLVVPADPGAVAAAIERVSRRRFPYRVYSRAARAAVAPITWAKVSKTLLAGLD